MLSGTRCSTTTSAPIGTGSVPDWEMRWVFLIENAAESTMGMVESLSGTSWGNIIAGNFGDGVLIRNTQKTLFPVTLDNYVQANWIGVDANSAPLPNRGAGVRIVNAAGTIVGPNSHRCHGRDQSTKGGQRHSRRTSVMACGWRVHAHRNVIRGNTI